MSRERYRKYFAFVGYSRCNKNFAQRLHTIIILEK